MKKIFEFKLLLFKLLLFKLLLFLAVGLILLSSCTKQKENKTKKETQLTKTDNSIDNSAENANLISENKLLFSDILWNISNSEGSINGEVIPAKATNIFIDSLGHLHLLITKQEIANQENSFYGAEIVADTLFDLGEFVFYIDSDLTKLPKNAKLRLRFLNPDSIVRSGIVETGFSFSYENNDANIKNNNILAQYLFSTNSKNARKHLSANQFTAGKTKHKLVMVKDAISYLSFAANNSLIEEYTISKYLSNNKKNKELTFFTPATKQKLAISFYCSDINEKIEECEVIISKIITKSIFSENKNVAEK